MRVLLVVVLAIALCAGKSVAPKRCEAEKSKLRAAELRILFKTKCGKCEIQERGETRTFSQCGPSCIKDGGRTNCRTVCKKVPWCPPKCRLIREQRRKVILERYSEVCGGVPRGAPDSFDESLDDWQCERLPATFVAPEQEGGSFLRFSCGRPGGYTKLTQNNLEFPDNAPDA